MLVKTRKIVWFILVTGIIFISTIWVNRKPTYPVTPERVKNCNVFVDPNCSNAPQYKTDFNAYQQQIFEYDLQLKKGLGNIGVTIAAYGLVLLLSRFVLKSQIDESFYRSVLIPAGIIFILFGLVYGFLFPQSL